MPQLREDQHIIYKCLAKSCNILGREESVLAGAIRPARRIEPQADRATSIDFPENSARQFEQLE